MKSPTKLKIFGSVAGLAALIFLIVGIISYPHFPFTSTNQSDEDVHQENYGSLVIALGAVNKNKEYKYIVASDTPQFVIFLFDGSKSVSMLNETLDFERKMNLESKPLHFTYFINAAYFLAPENAHFYQAPGQAPGVSKIGFSENAATIAARVGAFNVAEKEGNEIGSHSAGHFDGGSWSYDYWKQEFNFFQRYFIQCPKI